MGRHRNDPPEPAVVMRRLEILQAKLEDEGRYVGANTVALAQDLIQHQVRLLEAAGIQDPVSAAPGKNPG